MLRHFNINLCDNLNKVTLLQIYLEVKLGLSFVPKMVTLLPKYVFTENKILILWQSDFVQFTMQPQGLFLVVSDNQRYNNGLSVVQRITKDEITYTTLQRSAVTQLFSFNRVMGFSRYNSDTKLEFIVQVLNVVLCNKKIIYIKKINGFFCRLGDGYCVSNLLMSDN